MELIKNYFDLNPQQEQLFSQLFDLYADWNNQINLVSRKDFEHFYERHVLHSLSIAKLNLLKDSNIILDLGTGGGFPGIPLAIFYPEKQFILCDSIQKKVKAVEAISKALGLTNVECIAGRAEQVTKHYDTTVIRAVAKMEKLISFINSKSCKKLIALKGGDLTEELEAVNQQKLKVYSIHTLFEREFFETKKVVVLTA